MRIAHVVTLVSQDNAFGGPVSVAKAQTAELARRGHDVSLLAGWDGEATCEVAGVDVRLHTVRRVPGIPGFFGLVAPGILRELRRFAHELDVVHLHLARDVITLSAGSILAHRAAPFITQTHGMVMPDHRVTARAVDAVATRRVLRAARAVTALTDTEAAGLVNITDLPHRPVRLPNGIGLRQTTRPEARTTTPQIVFCARLHPRKRVLAFAEMAATVLGTGRKADFLIAGPDEGDLAPLERYLDDHDLLDRVRYVGAIEPAAVREFLASSSIFVLPSDREPFPMTLLEAMAEGTPAVITDGCMIAERIKGAGGPVVTDGTTKQLADAVIRLLDEPDEAREIGRRSRDLIESDFGIAAVVDQLESIYAGSPTTLST